MNARLVDLNAPALKQKMDMLVALAYPALCRFSELSPRLGSPASLKPADSTVIACP